MAAPKIKDSQLFPFLWPDGVQEKDTDLGKVMLFVVCPKCKNEKKMHGRTKYTNVVGYAKTCYGEANLLSMYNNSQSEDPAADGEAAQAQGVVE